MTDAHDGPRMGRRALLAGAGGALGAGAVGLGTAAPAGASATAPVLATGSGSATGRYPANWPDPAPYGRADPRPELWPRDDNSHLLDLELRPRDEALGRVWMRDTYVNCFEVDGRPLYVATGTTNAEGLPGPGPYNDGIFVWTARSLDGPWKLADTSKIRPDADRGKVWSPEFVTENTTDRTVVAPWQEWWEDDGQFGKRGNAWAPEVHYFQGKWYIVACMGDHSKKVGTFLLISEGGVEGPYRVAKGNLEKPFGDIVGGPDWIDPSVYFHIDGGFYSEGKKAWLVLHNHLYARFTADLEDIEPLQKFDEKPWGSEPYLEGAYVFRHEKKYYLLLAAWDWTSLDADGSPRYSYDEADRSGHKQYQYDTVVAVSDSFEGPYSERYTAGVGIGHNNFFTDHLGRLWGTFFLNPAGGYYSNASRVDDAAVPGVVRLEWTGPKGHRIYVKRPD
ncbi:family 43 glycosylhydrolase [Kineosporia sp. J2-2]|uniref:Family 43 glycosylhydrolase n=1 Tax=Kineosporia corallincola TaxID=2835133 RepID=A0ABS5TPI3_9ACTN|nr:family 43 glycosylhydrolase [Kineosporia corallincola]MBT0773001.1 family 43 glycosylhydrolase [Kineosporia corallincola]